jgi:AraC family transcriptional regulator, positive regulator of tynA and feaB
MQLTSMASTAQLPCLATTAGVSAREKFVYWHDAIARNLLDLDFGLVDETPFEATFSAASVDALSISTVKASAHKVSRTKASIARSASDHILLNFVLAGRLVAEQDGRIAIIKVGEAVACDARRTYSLRFDGPIELVNVRLPRQSLAHAVAGLQRVTAVNLNSSGPLCPLAFTYLNGLIDRAALLSETTAPKISNSFIELIAGLLIDAAQCSPAPLSDYRNLSLIRIKDFVERNLGDFDLDPTMVASALKLSPRYMNQLLEPEGTSLSRYIWRRRLESAAADLRNSALNGFSISSIALNNGFSDLSHFSKAFRDRFEHSPSEYRNGEVRGVGR